MLPLLCSLGVYKMKGLREGCCDICTHPFVKLAWVFILLFSSGTHMVNIFFLFDICHIYKLACTLSHTHI